MLSKISWIVPTMWRSTLFYLLLKKVSEAGNGDEVIVIDNIDSDRQINLPRVRQVFVSTNSFVNPAWNLGVSLSHNEVCCLVNDDVIFGYEAVREQILRELNAKKETLILSWKKRFKRIIGEDDRVILSNYSKLVDDKGVILGGVEATPELEKEGGDVYWGTGFLQAFAYDLYPTIPSQLRVFYGDTWLRSFYKVRGWRVLLSHAIIAGRQGASCDVFDWNSIGRHRGNEFEDEAQYWWDYCQPRINDMSLYYKR